jgi:hypothetical protein
VKVHHGCDVERIAFQPVNNGIRKAVEIELAIVSPDSAPPLRLNQDAAQGVFKLVKKGIPQPLLPLLIPQRGGFQFFVGLRMADDAHGACHGYPEQPAPPAGN